MSTIIKPNKITVSYEELDPSPDINAAMDRLTATRIFKCTWSNWPKFIKELLGWTEVVSGDNVVHLAHSYQPEGLNKLYCEEIVSVKGFGGLVAAPADTSTAEYAHAIIIAMYKIPDFDINEDPSIPIISESIEPASEFLTLNNDGLYWDNAQARPVGDIEAPAFLRRMFDWIYTIHRLSFIPPALINLVGYVNLYAVYSRSLNITFAPGVLLLGNPVLSREYTSLGVTMWSVTVRLTANEMGWNNFPEVKNVDASGNIWWGPVYNGSGELVLPYSYGNFSSVII